MPATLEELETTIKEVRASGRLDSAGAQSIQEFIGSFERNSRELYDAAIRISAQIYDRKQIAEFWRNQMEITRAQLVYLDHLQRVLGEVAPEFDIEPTIETFEQLVEAMRRRYEFHA
jgi:hypothetical protein